MILGEIINNQLYKIVELKRQLWEAEKELTRLNNQYAYGLLACYVMNIEATENAPKPAITIVNIPPKQAIFAIPAALMVNWSRGFSGAAYPVLGHGMKDGKRYFVLNISTDPNKAMPKHVWESETKAREIVQAAEEKAA